MYLKRYRTATVAEALAQARAELGPDALVLSTRVVAKRGLRGWLGARQVEVTAAADRPVSDGRPPWQEFRPQPAGGFDDPAVARLVAAGIDPAFAREVATAVPRSDRRAASPAVLRKAMADRLGPLAANDSAYAPVEVFVGPPGAGKTTVIAKIAAQERVRCGRRLSMVAADGYRVGAVDQLRLYAEVIGSAFFVARSPEEMERAISDSARPVLVDTAGRSPREGVAPDLFGVLSERGPVRTHLVLPAATAPRDADRIFDQFQVARPTRVALTRLDETDSLSPLLDVLRNRQLPVSYLGTGQRVPEDLHRATAPILAACVLGDGVSSLGGSR